MVKKWIKKAASAKKARSLNRKATDRRTTAPRSQKGGKFRVSLVLRVLDRLMPRKRPKSQILGLPARRLVFLKKSSEIFGGFITKSYICNIKVNNETLTDKK